MDFIKICSNASAKFIIRKDNRTLLAVQYGSEVSKEGNFVALREISAFITQHKAQLDETQLRLVTEARVTCEYLSREFCTIIQGPSLARELREI